jgi:hypothetical protein
MKRQSTLIAPLVISALAGITGSAHAVDGCLVLLCFAAPSWSSIQQCVPPVQQVLHDLARGKPFPTCNMAGAGNNASHQWSSAPTYCPPQYVGTTESDSGIAAYWCSYDGAISVTIDGTPWLTTWWSMGNGSVTDYGPAAKAKFGTWDTKFEDDYAVWVAAHPVPVACTGDC